VVHPSKAEGQQSRAHERQAARRRATDKPRTAPEGQPQAPPLQLNPVPHWVLLQQGWPNPAAVVEMQVLVVPCWTHCPAHGQQGGAA